MCYMGDDVWMAGGAKILDGAEIASANAAYHWHQMGTRRYLNMDTLKQQQLEEQPATPREHGYIKSA